MLHSIGKWLRRSALPGVCSLAAILGLTALGLISLGVSTAPLAAAQQAAVGDQQRINLEAVIAAGAKTLKDRVSFRISRFENGAVGPVVATLDKSPAELTLPAGQYRVDTVYGDVTVGSNLEVASKAVRHQVNLNAGRVSLKVIPHRGAKPVKGDVSWDVFTYGRDASGKRHLVATTTGPRPKLVLPHGYYLVVARTRDARVKHTIEVTAGHTYKYTLNLNAGSLRASALSDAGSLFSADEVVWEIYRKGAKKPLSSHTGATGAFTLREGHYTVVARAGEMTGSTEVSVRSGNTKKVNLTLR